MEMDHLPSVGGDILGIFFFFSFSFFSSSFCIEELDWKVPFRVALNVV